ncbi:hypothetical protein [Enteractinococcus helveticum]|uniref:Asparagine synthetase domain-containing protein n=1 Tax=Enteractinococcus helveticum TaxID=1837282 RepID=A0A1B7M2U7_9MICC|nr:hypothetical protein [Enteractinococcus helveticum]OAV62921.1 hypothetical protein A6F49_03730 [Enteractinococcus helveticum]
MHISGLYETTFLATNHSPPTNGFFQGYCFIRNDFIFGTNGALHYQALTGNPIPAAQDGCYVTIHCHNDAYVFDVDFAGYTILYYYHDGATWAVSNSFSRIIDYLRDQNISIRPNYAHLAAAMGNGMPLGQLFSFQTLAHNVRVAPRTHSLIITPSTVQFIRRPDPTATSTTYTEALSEYLNTWVSRFETLMHSPETDFTVDLTGGVDSRANFALVQAALSRLDNRSQLPRLHCSSSPHNQTDFEVATTIAGRYGFEINDNRTIRRLELHGDESYHMYRAQSMGVYYPFYRPTQGPTPTNITIGGGGGGIHRKLYELRAGSSDPNVFIEQNARKLKRPEYEAEFIADGQQFLAQAARNDEDPFRVLLRDGRVRYHSGRTPRAEVAFTPLHSVSAERVQLLAGDDRIEEGQFNYDIMQSLEPELVTMPYDSADKSPTNQILARLTSSPISKEAAPGMVWAPTAHIIRGTSANQRPAIEKYKTAFDKAVDNPFVQKFWRKTMLTEARELMDTLYKGKSIGNAANGKPIAAVLSTDLVTPN